MKYKRISDFPKSQAESISVLGVEDGHNVQMEVLSKEFVYKAFEHLEHSKATAISVSDVSDIWYSHVNRYNSGWSLTVALLDDAEESNDINIE